MKKRMTMVAVAGAVTGACVAMAAEVPFTLLSTWQLRRIPVAVSAGVAKWTNTYQTVAVVGIEGIGVQAAGSGLTATATFSIVSATLTNPAQSWSVTTNTLSPMVCTSAVAGTASGYGTITNQAMSFYGDVWTVSGLGTNGGIFMLSGFVPP